MRTGSPTRVAPTTRFGRAPDGDVGDEGRRHMLCGQSPCHLDGRRERLTEPPCSGRQAAERDGSGARLAPARTHATDRPGSTALTAESEPNPDDLLPGCPRQDLACGPLQRAHSDQVIVVNVPDVRRLERDQRLRSARGGHELHLKTIRLVALDDGTQVTTSEARLGQLSLQDHSVEQLEVHLFTQGRR